MKQYDHKITSQVSQHCWTTLANGQSNHQPTYAIILPPPNVTGTLHLGHAWDGTLQDMLIRYHKLQNFNVFWAAGMDHAGIATQTKFEKHLKTTNQKRTDFSRAEFINLIDQWKNVHANTIRKQWNQMGFILPTTPERFTLDEHSQAYVLSVFAKMYQDGLVYQDKTLVNWDVSLQTAISNIEVIHQDVVTKLYTINYHHVDDPNIVLQVATTRPETMFGDVCLFVHPNDPRYQHLVGQKFLNPANNQPLLLLTDDYIDVEFGTGVMKCTPAHDFNDWKLAKKHHLPAISCISEAGMMLANCGSYANLDRFTCRKQLIANLVAREQVIISDYPTSVGYSERTNEVVEPMLSKQWFVNTKKLAQLVEEYLVNHPEALSFWPNNYAQAIFRYLQQMEDWCISRQLSWGIQLPVWYHKKTDQVYVGVNPPANLEQWVRDQDVFDTWFSSGLWPLICCQIDQKTKNNYQQFFPTNVLVTGVDILFFWVSRMLMLSVYCQQVTPFNHVYLHGLIRDHNNKKMSKSLNNGIDPQTVIAQWGADTLRLFFITYTADGEDLIYSEKKVADCHKFLIKLWNAAQFLKLKALDLTDQDYDANSLSWCEQWILSTLAQLVSELKTNYQNFQFNLIAKKITHFISHDWCNNFLEFLKVLHGDQIPPNTQKLVAFVWKMILKLLNPITPFIAEYLYHDMFGQYFWDQQLTSSQPLATITPHPWLFTFLQLVRNLRNQLKISPQQKLAVNVVKLADQDASLVQVAPLLAVVNCQLNQVVEQLDPHSGLVIIINHYQFVLLSDQVVISHYQKWLKQKIAHLVQEVRRSEAILNNPNFTNKAPAAKIALEQQKCLQYQQELASYQEIYQLQTQQ